MRVSSQCNRADVDYFATSDKNSQERGGSSKIKIINYPGQISSIFNCFWA
jgi:hypothetical protein